ncbi:MULTISPECIES: hypothetical protein [unclassified Thalassospira]|uniref:P-loop ATPase, Sll1717 family n=1 Tax=Thalassospira TaxID=168934 RepID=UPI001B19EEC7|nr:hypothetical protein [Thalassospira sp.]MBO6770651.1 hypothetical protein [Thalassospira sp.]
MRVKGQDVIRFKKTDLVGFADAESDHEFLNNCFVETGNIEVLTNCNDPRCIILGRTGSGKTALVKRILQTQEHCIEISPEEMSLNYISNSNVIDFFDNIGVNLDLFYKLLWTHTFTVELIKNKYDITNREKKTAFLDRIKSIVEKDRSKEKAIQYLENWGDKFWEETEARVREITEEIENTLRASAGANFSNVSLDAEGAKKLSTSQKMELKERGTKVVNKIQIQDLNNLIRLLSDDIFSDKQNNFYIVIDKLDEEWIDSNIKHRLIKSLIESIKSFKRVSSVKIIIALRTDLKNRVIKNTLSEGFQEEKYRSLYLELQWSRQYIRAILESRVGHLFESMYTKHNVNLSHILPTSEINKRKPADYIIDRTFLRPREAIIFLNICIKKAEGGTKITVGNIKAGEMEYSKDRINSLEDEWRSDYPLLKKYADLISNKTSPFKAKTLISVFDDFALEIAALSGQGNDSDPILSSCKDYIYDKISDNFEIVKLIVSILYKVGMIGLKLNPHIGRQWSYLDEPEIPISSIDRETQIEVHETFWPILGTQRASSRQISSSSEASGPF